MKEVLNYNLPSLYHTGYLYDVKLRFIDSSSKEYVTEIKTHKFILYAAGVQSLSKLIEGKYNDLKEDDASINIELDFSLYTVDIIRLFIGILTIIN